MYDLRVYPSKLTKYLTAYDNKHEPEGKEEILLKKKYACSLAVGISMEMIMMNEETLKLSIIDSRLDAVYGLQEDRSGPEAT